MSGSDIAPYSAPITKLIDVVAKGIGVLYEPTRIVREANAHARAELILAATDEELALRQRAAARVVHMEMARQENIEKVLDIAQQELPREVSSAPVEQDWINNFFAGVQDISSVDLQKLWAKILAGEITTPGSYSRRLVDFLKTVDKREAEILTAVLSVCFTDKSGWHFYFSNSAATDEAVQSRIGNLSWERHLIDIGILSSQQTMPLVSKVEGVEIFFGGAPFVMHGPPAPPDGPGLPLIEHWVSMRYFTSIGQQISRVVSGTGDADLVVKISRELEERKVWIEPKTV